MSSMVRTLACDPHSRKLIQHLSDELGAHPLLLGEVHVFLQDRQCSYCHFPLLQLADKRRLLAQAHTNKQPSDALRATTRTCPVEWFLPTQQLLYLG